MDAGTIPDAEQKLLDTMPSGRLNPISSFPSCTLVIISFHIFKCVEPLNFIVFGLSYPNHIAAGEGKVDIDIGSTCTVHSASNPGYVPEPVIDSEIPIGGDYPEENENNNNNENQNSTTNENPNTTVPDYLNIPQEPTQPEPPPPVSETEPPPVAIDSMAPIGSE